MSLIIAIEPDRDQAAQLKDLIRRHTAAELILADTTDHAISAIAQRIPDLVLIPAFLSPEDDEALTSALRSTQAAAHVQTLTIPVLGTPQTPKSVPQSVLSRLLGDQPRPASPDSCDPKLFADQITDYLERVAKDRPLSGNGHGHLSPNIAAKKPKASPPPSAPVRHESKSGVKRAIPLPPAPASAVASKAVESPGDAADLQAALAQVSLDASSTKGAGGSNASADDALAMGLTSLMERLSAEEREETRATSAAKAATAPPPSPAPVPSRPVPEPAKPTASSTPAPAPTAKPVAAAPAETIDWKELKELESLEYAMPKNVLPRDEETGDPAPPAPAPVPAAAQPIPSPAAAQPIPSPAAAQPVTSPASPKSTTSEWGDLMESLKKDLGR
jgi:hypothetical protein